MTEPRSDPAPEQPPKRRPVPDKRERTETAKRADQMPEVTEEDVKTAMALLANAAEAEWDEVLG